MKKTLWIRLPSLSSLRDQFFAQPVSVRIGCIEKRDPEIERLVHQRNRFALGELPPPGRGNRPQPKADFAHRQLAGIGLDAQAVKETSTAFKRSFGPLSYLVSAGQIASRPPTAPSHRLGKCQQARRLLRPHRQWASLWE